MKQEIDAGVKFLRDFLAKYGQLTALQIDQFGSKLSRLLQTRYANHWYESQPAKGQAFRCLRLKHADSYIDPVLEQILRECGLSLSQLGLPNDFTLWIDPGEVSVRFGDQIGYTYTIARFELRSDDDDKASGSNSSSSSGDSAAAVLVNPSEKIFDDKLTAFIRQNSTSVALVTPKVEPDTEDGGITDAIASLAVDTPALNRRVNSSNISINAAGSSDKKSATESEIGETSLLNQQRQSYNDSCYYSSSSSSCSSSYEPEGPLSWIKSSELFSSDSFQPLIGAARNSSLLAGPSSSNLFNAAPGGSSAIFSTSPDGSMPLDSSNDPFAETLYPMISSLGGGVGGGANAGDVAAVSQDLSGGFVPGCFAQMFPADTASNRSDTPNSCMTTSSTHSAAFSYLPSSRSSSILTSSAGPVNTQEVSVAAVGETSAGQGLSSPSSDDSTSTAVQSSTGSLSKSPSSQQGDDPAKAKFNNSKGKKRKEKTPKAGSKEAANKKDESYCGYVESFPYYYKLNRLYNALALQKLQTERLKKSGILNTKGVIGSGGGGGSSSGGTPTGSRPGSSLSSKIELGTSPVGGPSDVSQLFLKQHPPIGHPVLSSSLQSTNPHAAVNAAKQQPFGSPGNFRYAQAAVKEVSAVPPTNNSKNGYPMSPTNAAISFANHHPRMNLRPGESSKAQLPFAGHKSHQTHHQPAQHPQTSMNAFQSAQQPMLPFSNLLNNLDFVANNGSSFHGSFAGQSSAGGMFHQAGSLPSRANNMRAGGAAFLVDPLADFSALASTGLADLLKSSD